MHDSGDGHKRIDENHAVNRHSPVALSGDAALAARLADIL
jgi:hypothetical protein